MDKYYIADFLFMGLFKQEVTLGETSLIINTRWVKLDIPYSKIEEAYLVNRESGFDLGRLITGQKGGLTYQGEFKNDEFGSFYGIFHVTAFILLVIKYDGGKVLVINRKSVKSTEELYAAIKEKAKL